MRHFLKIGEGLPILPLAHAIQFSDPLWGGQDPAGSATLQIYGTDKSAWLKLPQARPIVFDLMRVVEATALVSVLVERVKAQDGINYAPEEIDQTVYEVFLHNPQGAIMRIGEEVITPFIGEAWAWRLPAGMKAERWNGSDDFAVSMQMRLDTE